MRKRQFTLIEIMIVVAIIALLALIALPNFIQARRSARNTTCIANLKQIEGAKQTWAIQANALEGTAPTSIQLSDYFTGGIQNVVCPEVGVQTFTASYLINDMETLASCKSGNAAHTLVR